MSKKPTAADVQQNPLSRSISDDDLCADCKNLHYCPGDLSLCRLATWDSGWPGKSDENDYIIECKLFEELQR